MAAPSLSPHGATAAQQQVALQERHCELKECKGCLMGGEAAGLLQRETPSLYFRPSTVRHPCEDSPSRTPVAASLPARCQTEERPWGTKTDVTQFTWSESPRKKRQTLPGLRWVGGGGALGVGAEGRAWTSSQERLRPTCGCADGGNASQTCHVLRSMWKSHLLSVDRWSQVLPIRVSCWPSVPPLSILSSP